MSGFVGWFESITADEAVIEQEIKQIREITRDILKRIACRVLVWRVYCNRLYKRTS